METLTWIALALVVVVLLAWYLTYSAARLDRLHAKVEGAVAALDAQLVRRAESAIELGTAGWLDPASSLLLVDAATAALEASPARTEGAGLHGVNVQERGAAESDLTDALNLVLTADAVAELRMRGGDSSAHILGRIEAAALRVQLARRFHNQAVTEVQRVRRKRIVRVFRLAGHAPLPGTAEFDDEVRIGHGQGTPLDSGS
ncbi:MAG TPA: hypothetical protein GXZ60_15705 [Intrasporangiaceae bacterium]|nr:hypothetical protein [Intrasporangiaceae bacterium]